MGGYFAFAATLLPLGSACTLASQCASNYCINLSCVDTWQNQPCPEQTGLQKNKATIGGNAWNGLLGWVYNFWPADNSSSQVRVKKLEKLPPDTGTTQTGGEISGWSSYARLSSVAIHKLKALGDSCGQPSDCLSNNCTLNKCVGGTKQSGDTCLSATECQSNNCQGGRCVQSAAPSICWGATCGPLDTLNPANDITYQRYANNNLFCKTPGVEPGCLYPPTALYSPDDPPVTNTRYYDLLNGINRLKSYAELVYQQNKSDNTNVIKMCQVTDQYNQPLIVNGKPAIQTCNPDAALLIGQPKSLLTVKDTDTVQYCLYPVKGWMKIRQLKDDGWVRLSGKIAGTSIPVPVPGVDPGVSYQNWLQRVNCSTTPNDPVCSYQVYYDPSKHEFMGWAWSPKVRWLSFSGSTLYQTMSLWRNDNICSGTACTTISYDTAAGRSRWNSAFTGVWVQGLGGNLFSKQGFNGTAAPPSSVNSDYLIVTGGYGSGDPSALTGWESKCNDNTGSPACAAVSRKTFVPATTPTPDALRQKSLSVAMPQYSQTVNRSAIKRSSLGMLNTKALFPKDSITSLGKNAFGNMVQRITSDQDLQVTYLGNKIYYYEGDLVVGSSTIQKLLIQDGSSSAYSGAGTIVVKGNIIIRRPIGYTDQTFSDFKQLGSIAWVALKRDTVASQTSSLAGIPLTTWNQGGNIVFDDCIPSDVQDAASINNSQQMSRVAGVFFAENTIATGTGHGGQSTGQCSNFNTPVNYDTPIEIDGIVVAKDILFQRVYRGGGNGVASETIKNTGRYLVNPPPGLAEFAKSLPLW